MTTAACDPARTDRAVVVWLALTTMLVFAMVVVGGLTRLTDSGLSIVEWRPVTGAIPPLSDAQWLVEFEKYRASSEYALQNRGMGMDAFKVIYWWEWGHRMLGRVIGLVYALPLVAFWLMGRIPPDLRVRLVVLLGLGGLQGAIGWWMVASGLVNRVDVSHYRLAVHLGMAALILTLLWWTLRDVVDRAAVRARVSGFAALAAGLTGLVFAQILLGALVAGLDAGRIHTGWPLIEGRLLPPDYGTLSPWWRDALETRGSVQFHHRIGGYVVGVFGVVVGVLAWRAGSPAVRRAGLVAGAAVAAQVALGIWTLTAGAPLALSAAHQALAAILLLAAAELWRTAARDQVALSSVRRARSNASASDTTLTTAPSATSSTPSP